MHTKEADRIHFPPAPDTGQMENFPVTKSPARGGGGGNIFLYPTMEGVSKAKKENILKN